MILSLSSMLLQHVGGLYLAALQYQGEELHLEEGLHDINRASWMDHISTRITNQAVGCTLVENRQRSRWLANRESNRVTGGW